MEVMELDKKTVDALNSDDDYAAIESSSWLTGEIADGKAKEEMLSYFSEVVKREYPELSLSLAWEKYKEENNVSEKEKARAGFEFLVNLIGRGFYEKHEDSSVFSYGDEGEKGLFCFLGISLRKNSKLNGLSASMDEWDVYASCYVIGEDVVLDKCKLPK